MDVKSASEEIPTYTQSERLVYGGHRAGKDGLSNASMAGLSAVSAAGMVWTGYRLAVHPCTGLLMQWFHMRNLPASPQHLSAKAGERRQSRQKRAPWHAAGSPRQIQGRQLHLAVRAEPSAEQGSNFLSSPFAFVLLAAFFGILCIVMEVVLRQRGREGRKGDSRSILSPGTAKMMGIFLGAALGGLFLQVSGAVQTTSMMTNGVRSVFGAFSDMNLFQPGQISTQDMTQLDKQVQAYNSLLRHARTAAQQADAAMQANLKWMADPPVANLSAEEIRVRTQKGKEAFADWERCLKVERQDIQQSLTLYKALQAQPRMHQRYRQGEPVLAPERIPLSLRAAGAERLNFLSRR